jgi:hypothetical protein
MEACATSHCWGRVAQGHGHDVRLIPPIDVKPFVRRQKNDAADAAAIAEAVLRPNIHFVGEERRAAGAGGGLPPEGLPPRGHPLLQARSKLPLRSGAGRRRRILAMIESRP